MDILRINGGIPLSGNIKVQGAKNSALPILAAAILAENECVIHNCPNLRDVDASIKILRHLGCKAYRNDDTVYVDTSSMNSCEIPDGLMREMRSSVIFLGAILGRMGRANLSMPGGCELGPRPIDLHLEAMKALGASVDDGSGNILCMAPSGLKGTKINLKIPSVGATENVMLAACRAKGITILTNAAREPEIEDLQDFLNKLGAEISGAGTSTIVINRGVESRKVEHTVISDRIVASTYLAAAAATGGTITLENVIPTHLSTVISVLEESGCIIEHTDNMIKISADRHLKSVSPIITSPYPGFPTDAQPPIMAASLKFTGTTAFVENIFENRYRHAEELKRMGAVISTEGKVALVKGGKTLYGAYIKATDLRGGAALVVAALAAKGESCISDIYHIDRGYEKIEEAFSMLGGNIKRE